MYTNVRNLHAQIYTAVDAQIEYTQMTVIWIHKNKTLDTEIEYAQMTAI